MDESRAIKEHYLIWWFRASAGRAIALEDTNGVTGEPSDSGCLVDANQFAPSPRRPTTASTERQD